MWSVSLECTAQICRSLCTGASLCPKAAPVYPSDTPCYAKMSPYLNERQVSFYSNKLSMSFYSMIPDCSLYPNVHLHTRGLSVQGREFDRGGAAGGTVVKNIEFLSFSRSERCMAARHTSSLFITVVLHIHYFFLSGKLHICSSCNRSDLMMM